MTTSGGSGSFSMLLFGIGSGLALACTPNTGGILMTSGDLMPSTGAEATTTGGASTTAPDGTTADPVEGDSTTDASTTDASTTAADTTSSESGEPEAFYRREIVLAGDTVTGDDPLLDFTVRVAFGGDDGMAHVGSGGHVLELDGADMVFRDADLQPLARELTYFPESGRFTAWVRVPELATDAPTTLYLDYGARSLVGQSPFDAWNDAYVGVWHFEDDVMDGGAIVDSSVHGHHGTALALDASNAVVGRVGQGVSLTQPTAAIRVGGGALDLPGPLTFEGWGRMDGPLPSEGFQRLFQKGGEGGNPLILWVGDPTLAPAHPFGDFTLGVNFEEQVWIEVEHSIPGFGYGQWHHYAAVVGGPGDEIVLFVDGVRVTSEVFDDPVAIGYPNLYFGNRDTVGTSRQWNGVIDEFRFSDVARSDAWIEASWRNISELASFVTVGPEQAMP